MTSSRPRRVLRASTVIPVARITVPAVLLAALVTGVAIAALPGQESRSAEPVAQQSSAAVADRAAPDRATRDQARPEPTPSALPSDSPFARNRVFAADEAESAAKAAAEKAAADKAAAKKPAAKKPAAKGAAGKKVAAKKAAAKKPAVKRIASRITEKLEVAKAEPKLDLTVVGTRYLTSDLNLRTEPDRSSKVLSVLQTRSKVRVTDTVEDGFRLIVRSGKGRWVTDEYLARKRPKKENAVSDASCNKSSSIESGLQPNGVKVYRALCARFPNISSFGGRRSANGGFHPSGRAVDAMISNGGWEVARWVRANADRLGVSEVIHAQKIWTVQRSGEGWRSMSDLGNATANHYDHVHVSVY